MAAMVDYPRNIRLEIYRRRRIAAAALLVGIVLFLMVATLAVQAALGRTGGGPLAATGALPGGQLADDQAWVVRPGDTIWSIAEAVEPHGDVRPLVDRISAELGGRPLYAGERLNIPVGR
ncbi:MAG TPA: LysM peptidoglycan-binding domain-containing protein [Acidimicrobiales bacterium]